MPGKIIQEKNKNQVKQKKTRCILNAGFALQPKYNTTSHRDTTEGLEGNRVLQKWKLTTVD